ncbi:putative PTS system protein [Pseudoalteromonas luteoviolacea B = ATCC 29581]|nr:putative PTS system protein [Pseudoalteromonas luteoviolacea B = ATCC 29581]
MSKIIEYSPITAIANPLYHIASPFSGKVTSLTAHSDAIFALGVLGPGVLVELTGELMVSPFDGKIEAIKQGGVEWVLVSNLGQKLLLHLSIPWQFQTPEYLKLLKAHTNSILLGEPLLRFALPPSIEVSASMVLLSDETSLTYYYVLKQVRAGLDPLITAAEEVK